MADTKIIYGFNFEASLNPWALNCYENLASFMLIISLSKGSEQSTQEGQLLYILSNKTALIGGTLDIHKAKMRNNGWMSWSEEYGGEL